MLTFGITGFFDRIPHAHLTDTLQRYHIPLPIVRWVHSFLQERKTALCLDGKRDELGPVETGVPQGSCVSPVLAAYFTSPMINKVHRNTAIRIEQSPELSTLLHNNQVTLLQTTLYVDDGTILALGPTLKVTFKETHKWLHQNSLKTDEVKNELMHFTQTKAKGSSPGIIIPMNMPGIVKEVIASTSIRYLSLWFDPQLKFHEHVKMAAVSEKTLLQGGRSGLGYRKRRGKTRGSAGVGLGLVLARQWCV